MVEETYRKDFPVSWEEMHRDAKALAWRLQDKGPWKGVVAITRGGMVPACIVAREIDILTVQTLCIASYDYKDQSKAKLLHEPSLEDGGKGWLVIDDLADTGKTFKLARRFSRTRILPVSTLNRPPQAPPILLSRKSRRTHGLIFHGNATPSQEPPKRNKGK